MSFGKVSVLAGALLVGASARSNIVDTAVAGNFTVLVEALTKANLVSTLSQNGPFTVFAPTDAAFRAALTQPPLTTLGITTVAELLNMVNLADILTYHVVSGSLPSGRLTSGMKASTVQGSTLRVTFDGSTVKINTETDLTAVVTDADVMCSNGVIHIIDQVLLPPMDIVETGIAAGSFRLLTEALTKMNLTKILKSKGPKPFTVYAPTDAAFLTALAALGTTKQEFLDRADLAEILTYHVVSGSLQSANMKNGMEVETLHGSKLKVTIHGSVVKVNTAMVTAADVMCSNGVLHIVDTVLLPPADANSNIVYRAVAAGQFTILAEALSRANLVVTLRDSGPFTVFAPTDSVFMASLTVLGTTRQEFLNRADLAEILSYHVVSGLMKSTDLLNGTYSTLQGSLIKTYATQDRSIVTINTARMTSANIMGSNGVIHIIDQMLFPPLKGSDIVYTVVAAGSFTILAEALTKTNLLSTLSSEGPYTVFAPTDAAFLAALTALGNITKQALFDRADFAEILRYHLISESVMSTDLKSLALLGIPYHTVQGSQIKVDIDGSTLKINTARVASADVMCSNGVIHIVDQVLLPPAPLNDIVDTAVAKGVFTVLAAALTKANLVSTLKSDGPFTVFAPTDAAFTNALAAQGITKADLLKLKEADLAEILKYHVLSGSVKSADMNNGMEPATVQGSKLKVSRVGSTVKVNTATVTSADVKCSNGLINVIDSMLLPPNVVGLMNVWGSLSGLESFTMLIEAVTKADLVGVFTSRVPFTVFAPTDEAFSDALETLGFTKDLLLDMPGYNLQNLLTYHLVGGAVKSIDVSNGMQLPSMQGATLNFVVEGNTMKVKDARITNADILCSNGVIHIIDKVLIHDMEKLMLLTTMPPTVTKKVVMAAAHSSQGLTYLTLVGILSACLLISGE